MTATPGYSGKPLAAKLGIKPEHLVLLDNAPAGFVLDGLPAGTSVGVPTDLDENGIRELALPLGVVDVKVCAIDTTWSGLKLVRRLANR
jgi:hypothetical protein